MGRQAALDYKSLPARFSRASYLKGFSIIELLVVSSIVGILIAASLLILFTYIKVSIRVSVVSDLRNCITQIASYTQAGSYDLQQLVDSCTKGKYTDAITLESVSPLVIKAVSSEGELSCIYSETTGEVICDNVF